MELYFIELNFLSLYIYIETIAEYKYLQDSKTFCFLLKLNYF